MGLPTSMVVSFEEARRIVDEQAARLRPQGKELVGLLESAGRVLAEPIHADRDFPPFRRAARDGYAVRAADLATLPTTLPIVGEIRAGAPAESAALTVQPGQAVSIMTGAPTPEGADAIVMVEHTTAHDGRVEIRKSVRAGENIVATGSEAQRGERLLSPGIVLDHTGISVAASTGRVHLLVYARPKVAVLATGDEIVDIDVRPGPHQIRNSNSYSLGAQIQAAGGEPILLPIAPDEPHRLRELLEEGLEADLLLIAGGVSMGKYDLVETILAELSAQFLFTGAKIQPGKPIVFGRWGAEESGAGKSAADTPVRQDSPKYFFGLPGNPVSTMVTFDLFVRPVLGALCGAAPRPLIFLRARLKSEIQTRTGLKRFLPAVLCGGFEQAEVELARWQGSGDIAATARANCYIVIPPDREKVAAGEWVPILPR
jgi:molybdopterin molybdotransferase